MPTQYGDETVEELAEFLLPFKQNYIANLRSVAPPADEPTCAICRGEWDYPAQNVVEPSPHCSLHPIHKECLLLTFATEDGEEVSNLCPFCRRELFEKVPSPQPQHAEAEDNFDGTFETHQNIWDEIDEIGQIEYADFDLEDPQLLYPSSPTIEDALQQEGFWACLPRFLDEWYDENSWTIIERTQGYVEPLRSGATGLTDEGRAAITALFAHENNSAELALKATELLDHQDGEIAMQCIGAAFQFYDDSAFAQLVGDLDRETRWLIAYHILTSLLTGYRHVGENFHQKMDFILWLALIRFRKMLYQEIRQWAANTFFGKLFPVKFELDCGPLVGPTINPTGHETLEIEPFIRQTDGTMTTAEEGPWYSATLDSDFPIVMVGNLDFPLNPNMENGTLIHFVQNDTMIIWEFNPCFLHNFTHNPEEGYFDLIGEHGHTLRVRRRVVKG